MQEPDSDKFESLFEKLKKEKEKKEVFYLFMKTFDKLQEVSSFFNKTSQFRDEYEKNKAGKNNSNNLNNENNNNEIINNENNNNEININENENNENKISNNFLLTKKNELLEFKNDFVQMKTLLLSHKRNPEEKLEKILDKKNSEE